MAFGLLAAGFAVCVAAQALHVGGRPDALAPGFGRLMSRRALAAGQMMLVAGSFLALWAMWTGRPRPQPRLGRVMVWIGWLYLVGAAYGFFAQMSLTVDLGRLDASLPGLVPGLVHLMLAAMVLLFAAHLSDEARRPAGA